MRPTETELRRGFAALADEAAGGLRDLDAEAVWRAVRGDLEPEAVGRLADRAAREPELAEAWRLAVEVVREERAAGVEGVAAAPPARRRRWIWPAGLAAAAVLVVGLVLPQLAGDGARLRGEGGRGEIESLLPEGRALDRDAATLRWSAVPGATRYRVTVLDGELEAVAVGEDLGVPRFTVPSTALEALPQGSVLLWRVEAGLASGDRIRSPTFTTPLADAP